jgi:hypothetical protein
MQTDHEEEPSMKRFVEPKHVETQVFDWGRIQWLSEPRVTGTERITAGVVTLAPGKGHQRHNHPGVEEILYVIEGEGIQIRPPSERARGQRGGQPEGARREEPLRPARIVRTLRVQQRKPSVLQFLARAMRGHAVVAAARTYQSLTNWHGVHGFFGASSIERLMRWTVLLISMRSSINSRQVQRFDGSRAAVR